MKLYCGTSGFSYPKWKGGFYPKGAKSDALLQHYAERLPSVEINNTFYRMPRESVVQGWKAQVPGSFRFAMKASRRITHYAKLKGTEDNVQFLLQALTPLEGNLGVVLFQMPPQFQKSLDVLRAFLASLPASPRVAMEFRHRTWFDDDVYALLRDSKVALVGGDGDAALPDFVNTTDFGYLRLRQNAYDVAALQQWNERLGKAGLSHAFVYFKHEVLGPHFAEQLLKHSEGGEIDAAALRLPEAAPSTPAKKPARPAAKAARLGLKKAAPKPAQPKRETK